MTDGPIRGTVFLSHASADKIFVDRVLRGLDPATTFYDIRTMQPGQATIEAMRTGVSSSAVYVLFHSAESRTAWVDFEKSLAEVQSIVNPSTKILVCPINGSDYRSLPPWMARYMTTTKDFCPNDIVRSIQYLHARSIDETYPEMIRTFPGREALERKITLSLMRGSAATGQVLSALVLTGLQGTGRGTLAATLVKGAYQGMRPAGPVFEIPPAGDAIDWHLRFLADLNEGLSDSVAADQIAAFAKMSPNDQAKILVLSLRHWGDLNQVVTIRHRWGLRDKGNQLRPWFLELMKQLQSVPAIRLILVSERRLPLDPVKDLGNVQQFALEELDSETIEFILTERVESRYLDPQRLPALAARIHGHPATANYTAYLINGGRSMESLVMASNPVAAFQDRVLADLFDSGILSEIQKRILRLLSIYPQMSSAIISKVFDEYDPKDLMEELWELVEFSLAVQSDGGKYRAPAVVSSTYRRRTLDRDSEVADRVAKILSSQFEDGDLDLDLIDSLLVSVVASGSTIPDRLLRSITPARIEPVIEKEYFDGSSSVGDEARIHYERCCSLARLAMGMNVADDSLENILFYGADASVRLGILPEDMLKVMQQKGFLTVHYIRASFLFHSERDFDGAAAELSKSLAASGFRRRNVRLLTRIYLRDGKFLEALDVLNKVPLSNLMRDTGLVVMKVKALRGTRNRADAAALLAGLNDTNDDYGDYAIYQASAALREGRYLEAIERIKSAKKAPRVNKAVLSFLQCACEVENGDNSSLAVTIALARSMKRDSDALQLQARSALAAGDWRSAEDYISRVRRKDWFDLNVEYRAVELKLTDPAIARDPVAYETATARKEEILRRSASAVEGSSYA